MAGIRYVLFHSSCKGGGRGFGGLKKGTNYDLKNEDMRFMQNLTYVNTFRELLIVEESMEMLCLIN